MTAAQPEFRLLLDYENEVARWRRRTAFLVAVIFQLLLTILLIVSPRLFRSRAMMLEAEAREKPRQETTLLYFPRDLIRPARKPPKTNILSDKNRIAQGKSPVIDKNGLPMPYMRGNTKMPDIAGGKHTPGGQTCSSRAGEKRAARSATAIVGREATFRRSVGAPSFFYGRAGNSAIDPRSGAEPWQWKLPRTGRFA
jgi:hypothetical protein